jgi:hypothetical protein
VGEARTARDFARDDSVGFVSIHGKEASFIFQHGNTVEDCLFAHVLAMEALVKGDESAKWIAAATLDRYL